MTPRTDFICLSFAKTDLLIEKSLINTSIYFGVKERNENFSRIANVMGKEVQVYNLDFIVKRTFKDSVDSDEKMLLQLSDFYFETCSEAFVKQIPLSEFRLFGSLMDTICQSNGVVAVRYDENKRIQYLLDIKKFLSAFEKSESWRNTDD